jgi:hypothetical protein
MLRAAGLGGRRPVRVEVKELALLVLQAAADVDVAGVEASGEAAAAAHSIPMVVVMTRHHLHLIRQHCLF